MPLAAQRRHVIASLHHPFPAMLLYQHLLCPNIILLVIRSFVQTRIATPRKSHPEATLRILALFVLGLNLFATFIHVLDLAEGPMPGKSLLIDFVGLRTPPRPMVILGLDAFIAVYQLVTLYIGYLSFPAPNGTAHGFPVDPLLPPRPSRRPNGLYRASAKEVIFQNQEDDEESQILNARQEGRARAQTTDARRPRPNRVNSPSREQEEDEYDLYSEDDDLLQRTDPDGDVSGDTCEYQRSSNKEEPYTIVDIPVLFMLKTIFSYPRPTSIASLDTSATAEAIATPERTSTDRASDTGGIPRRSRLSSANSADLRIQALGGFYPGTTNTAAREHGEETGLSDEEDGRDEYRRMPGGYRRPSA